MVAFDSTYLSLILNPASPPPVDASTKKPVEQAKERINFLILTLEKQKEKILIPTPVLGEVLVLSGKSGPDYLARLERSSHFEFGDFDRRAAVEFATSVAMAKGAGDKRRGMAKTCAKAKFDEQVVAIAKVHNVIAIYSDDKDIADLCATTLIKVIPVRELSEPPEEQAELPFDQT